MKVKKNILSEKLPLHTAPAGMWENIEKQLDFLENVGRDEKLIAKLPKYGAPNIFDKIVPQSNTRKINLYFIRIAASILLIIGLGIGFSQFKNRTKTQISYSVEENSTPNSIENIANFTYDSDFNAVLNQKCKTSPGVCSKKEFDELFAQLKDIEREEQTLKQTLEQYKNPELVSHLVRLTNDKIKLENYILNLFS